MLKTSLKVLSLLAVFSIGGCQEKNTKDAIKTYTYWAGEPPSKEVQPMHGKYWQSYHWSKEYIMYLELQSSSIWINEFIRQNNLVEKKEIENLPPDAPLWFKPGKNFLMFKHSGYDNGSACYIDSAGGKMFIYEIQL